MGPPFFWLATGFLCLLQNDTRLLIYSELISPLIRVLVNLRASNSRGVDPKDQMTGRKNTRGGERRVALRVRENVRGKIKGGC